jgi:lipopolysaccharide export LptBFGC system permease protein LptF
MFGLRELATDEVGARRDAVHDRLRERRSEPVIEDLWVHDQRGRPVRLREVRLGSQLRRPEARGLSSRYREGDLSVSTAADLATPLPDGRWSLVGGRRLEWDAHGRRSAAVDVLEDIRFTLEDVVLAWKGREHPTDLSFAELRELLERDPTNDQYRTMLQYHFTFPLAGLVLLLVGLPFVVGQERGRAGERIARGFFLCVGYFGVDFIARTLGLQGQIGPFYAGWFPVVLFGSLGIVLTASMRS